MIISPPIPHPNGNAPVWGGMVDLNYYLVDIYKTCKGRGGWVEKNISLQSKLSRYREDLEKFVIARMLFLAFVGFVFCCLDSSLTVRKFPESIGIPSNRLDFRKNREKDQILLLVILYLLLLPSFPDTTTEESNYEILSCSEVQRSCFPLEPSGMSQYCLSS